jgi:hypothetical protein
MNAHRRQVPDYVDQAKTNYENEAGENDQRCQDMHALSLTADAVRCS